jgi:hypothetical protein
MNQLAFCKKQIGVFHKYPIKSINKTNQNYENLLLNNDYSSNHENNAISIYPGFVFSTVTLEIVLKDKRNWILK